MSCIANGNPVLRVCHYSDNNRGESNMLQRRSELVHARLTWTMDTVIFGFRPLLSAARGQESLHAFNVSVVHVCEVAPFPMLFEVGPTSCSPPVMYDHVY